MPRLGWDNMIQLLRDFKTEYGRLPKKDEDYRGVKVGQWCVNQRRALRAGSYDDERIAQLQDLGIVLSIHDVKWEQNQSTS